MSKIASFKSRLAAREPMSGTFMKTPHYVLVEVLAQSGLDFLCLDTEHAPFDRAALDQCLAVACALDFPVVVRVGEANAKEILWALDYGAVGVVVPHVDSVEKAQDMAKAARFGLGGRGYAGSTRWGGYGTQKMPNLLEKSRAETVVIAQIEEPYAVPLANDIAALDGIDGLFTGPADLAVGLGETSMTALPVQEGLTSVGAACQVAGKTHGSFLADPAEAASWLANYGVNMFFFASEHTWMRQGANVCASAVTKLKNL